MRRRVSTAMDSDALQADVMRFMAIIAFCLVAVLALVRQIEPAAAEDAQAAAPVPAELGVAPNPLPVESPAPEPTSAVAAVPPAAPERPDAVEPEPVVAQQPGPQAAQIKLEPILSPIEPLAAPEAVAEVEVVPPPQPADVAAAEPDAAAGDPSEPAQSADEQSETGLILRFATDQDFLRLVAKGDIRVFLFGADSSFRLRSDYRFAPAPTPRQLFEVMPATVPALIRRRAAILPDSSALRYGLEFPERIERQLDAYLAQVESGALLIDRFGHVSHVSNKY